LTNELERENLLSEIDTLPNNAHIDNTVEEIDRYSIKDTRPL